MSNCRYHGIGLVADALDEHDLKYHVDEIDEAEVLNLPIPSKFGPSFTIRFINTDDGNDIQATVTRIIGDIPVEERVHAMTVCNKYSSDIRWIKLFVDRDGDVNIKYSFPMECDDATITEGTMAIVYVIHTFLDRYYKDIITELG